MRRVRLLRRRKHQLKHLNNPQKYLFQLKPREEIRGVLSYGYANNHMIKNVFCKAVAIFVKDIRVNAFIVVIT